MEWQGTNQSGLGANMQNYFYHAMQLKLSKYFPDILHIQKQNP